MVVGFLVTGDIAKFFDPLDHGFLLLILKKLDFDNNFIDWVN